MALGGAIPGALAGRLADGRHAWLLGGADAAARAAGAATDLGGRIGAPVGCAVIGQGDEVPPSLAAWVARASLPVTGA
jgi:hypothetical protein